MIARRLIIAILPTILGACASTPSPREQILSGLEQETRTVAIRIDETPPHQGYQVHESQAGRGAARGAGAGALAPLSLGDVDDPYGLAAGILLMPVFAVVGAVVGAATADPIVHHYALDEVEGAQSLVETTAKRANLLLLLKKNLFDRASTQEGHKILYMAPDGPKQEETGALADVRMWVRINRYSLVGEIEKDPSVKLLVEGETGVAAQWTRAIYWCDWSYESSNRRISDWASNDGEKFVEEIQKASRRIASDILAVLRPGSRNCNERTGHGSSGFLSEIAKKEEKQINIEQEPTFAGGEEGEVAATHQIRRTSAKCAESKDSEKPWIGNWTARNGKTTLRLALNETAGEGYLKIGGTSYEVRGGVDDRGEIIAEISGRDLWDNAQLEGQFPVVKLTSGGSGRTEGGGRSFRAVQGMTFDLCS